MRVCFVGDDVRPPWNHASSILTKRLIECLSPRIECTLATVSPEGSWNGGPIAEKVLATRGTGNQSRDAVKLSFLIRGEASDILHLVGTNALLLASLSKILGQRGRIVRHIFTPYDTKDRIVRPARWLANRFSIDSYAFTTPWIGPWVQELSGTQRFLLRPPINCEFYKPLYGFNGGLEANGSKYTLLYMGPLLPSRFPYTIVLEALKSLKKKGVDASLVVLTSPSRTSDEQCRKVLDCSRDFSVERNLVLKRVDLSEEERIHCYNSADVVIFPYVGPQPEKLADPPFGILEAMSCGRVVLASNVLSVPEVVEDGVTGFLFSKVTAEELAAGLLKALESPERGKIATNARSKILQKFDYAQVREDALRIYSSLLN